MKRSAIARSEQFSPNPWAVALVVVGLGAQPAPAQVAGGEFDETVSVRVVNVDVWVSDRKGRPIEGLTRDDFVLFEDGVEVPIVNFYAVGAAPREVQPERKSDVAAPAGPSLPLLDMSSEVVHAVVYLDGNTLRLTDRAAVLDDLRDFAQQNAGREVRFALASASLGANLEASFTADPAELVAALERVGTTAPPAGDEVREYRRGIDTLQRLLEIHRDRASTTGCADDGCRVCGAEVWPVLLQAWETYAVAASARTRTSIDNLAEIVSSLGGIPGRKALFFVSSGFQQRPGLALLQYLSELCTDFQREAQTMVWRFDETGSLEELTARANANRVTLHTLDAGRVRKRDAASVAYENIFVRPSALVGDVRRSNLQNSLFILADQTGGEVIFNDNAPLAELGRLLDEQRSGYSLGFSPARAPDGSNHRLQVQLRDKHRGAEIRYRRSYRDKPESERLGDRLMASLHHGVEDNPLAISAAAGPAEALDRGRFEVPLVVRVPVEHLSFIGGPEGGSARLHVFLAAEDAGGRRTPLREEWIELDSAATGAPAGQHQFVVAMELRQGPHRIALGVRDERTGVLSLLRLQLDVAASEDAHVAPGDAPVGAG